VAKIGRNDPCPCRSGRKYKKCCGDRHNALTVVREQIDAAPQLQLVVETGQGFGARTVSPAMPRRLRYSQGTEAENSTHEAAALWGLADFVFESAVRHRASGVRELGDGIVLVGDIGVVLQVKSREAPTEDQSKERRWVIKQSRKAVAQGAGTIRELEREPALMTNLRGRKIELDGKNMSWLIAVIIDHDEPPTDVVVESRENAVVLLRRDWDFLFQQLKSTHGVVRYLERVAGEAIDLGSEPIRYYELAGLDEEAESSPFGPEFLVPGATRSTEPLLPVAPAGTEQQSEHRFFRGVLEDIASIRLEKMPEALRIRSLAQLDRLATRQRALVGQFFLEAFETVWTDMRPGISWRHRRFAGPDGAQLGFGVCSRGGGEMEKVFRSWVELRHHEFSERIGADDLVTIGVLVTPRADGERAWDTSMTVAEGCLDLTAEQLNAYVDVWKREGEAAA
jgi:SEC-C motif